MKRVLALALLAFVAAACGKNPLLKDASSDYAPLRVGDTWTYVTAQGGPAFTTTVSGIDHSHGRAAYIFQTLGVGVTTTAYVSDDGKEIDQYSSGAWVLDRKIPYVLGNRWPLPSTALVHTLRSVDGQEDLPTPAGTFYRCYRLKDEIQTYDPVQDLTTTTGAFLWVAPEVGDVARASIDVSGTATTQWTLSSYALGPQ